jgi:hypothetical protein
MTAAMLVTLLSPSYGQSLVWLDGSAGTCYTCYTMLQFHAPWAIVIIILTA